VISFETAKALKEAGLEWEPKLGDLFNTLECIEAGNTSFCIWDEEIQEAYDTSGADIDGMHKGSLWLPRLDQLLAEIVKNIWGCRLSVLWIEDFPTGYECLLSRREETEEGKWDVYAQRFVMASPEEAAAQALLWILRKETTK
jgi:hypothetical protein